MTDLTYVVADLHGRFDLLEIALGRIEAKGFVADGARTVVFLGDYVDRGPQSRQVIERLMAGPPEGWTWVTLKGNHEDGMVITWLGHIHPDWWMNGMGGAATLRSYGREWADDDVDWVSAIPIEHIAWARYLPTLHQDKHRIYVHAGVDPTLPPDRQDDQFRLWMRTDCPLGHGDHHVVHGHTPYVDGPRMAEGRTNLDTMAFRTGRIVVGVFDDAVPGGPIELMECIAETRPRILFPDSDYERA